METLEQWIEQRARRQTTLALLLSPLALLGGLLVLFLSFWFFYVVIFIMEMGVRAILDLFMTNRFHVPHGWRLVLSAAWLVALGVSYVRKPMSNMEPMPAGNYVHWSPTFHGGGSAAGLVMLAAYPGATAHLLRDLLQTGPRLLHGAIALWKMATAMKALQPALCGAYLDKLVRAGGAVRWSDLEAIYGAEYVGPAANQLRAIDGVVFLEKGLSLTSELRRELRPLVSRTPEVTSENPIGESDLV